MFRMTVADVFFIRGRGLVATGRVEEGSIRVGDTAAVNGRSARVEAIEAFRKKLDAATVGDNIGLLFKDLTSDDVKSGDLITAESASTDSSWEQDFPGGLPR
jgi:elongation factor Tu